MKSSLDNFTIYWIDFDSLQLYNLHYTNDQKLLVGFLLFGFAS